MAFKLIKAAKAIPAARLLVAGEVVMMARHHWHRLEPAERRQFLTLMARGHGRKRNLSENDQAELARLIAKANPRLFLGLVAQRFSPVPLPHRIVEGPRRS
jgi:TRAP-type C4-dicarboxylate transport system substrate-binding protein